MGPDGLQAHSFADEVGIAARAGLEFRCRACDWRGAADPPTWCCPRCGGPLDFVPESGRVEDPSAFTGAGVWRYAPWLSLAARVSLGEPTTPLVDLATPEGAVRIKNEGLSPSGSFKDRGAATLVAWLAEHGVRRVVIDSSGNAGAALAAYCARSDIGCEVFTPAYTSRTKVAHAQACGAKVWRLPGSRADAASAALDAVARRGAVYASHKWSPAFLLGTQTLAYELWEQAGRMLPDVIAMPVGAGTLLLGVASGCEALRSAGLVDRVPRLLGVQSAGCAPVAAVFGHRLDDPGAGVLAEGIQVAEPPRLRQVVAAIARSHGTCLAVREVEIREAHERLGRQGLLAEPTAATSLAGWSRALQEGWLDGTETAVVVLTGSGLKTVGGSCDSQTLSDWNRPTSAPLSERSAPRKDRC